jgi:Type II CAAX prenyl endopeptidase Rce1-like
MPSLQSTPVQNDTFTAVGRHRLLIGLLLILTTAFAAVSQRFVTLVFNSLQLYRLGWNVGSSITGLLAKAMQILAVVLVIRTWLGLSVSSAINITPLSKHTVVITVALFLASLWAVKTGGYAVGIFQTSQSRSAAQGASSASHARNVDLRAPEKALEARPIWYLILSSLVNGVSEEMVFRGCIIEIVEAATRSTILATAFSLALDTAVHVPYWGAINAVGISLSLLLDIIVYLRYRNLTVCILAHASTDLFLSIGPHFLAPQTFNTLWNYL